MNKIKTPPSIEKTAMFFRVEDLRNLVEKEDSILKEVSRKLTDVSRWDIYYDIIFEYENKFYLFEYSTGATESQDYDGFTDKKNDDKISCTEMEPYQVMVTKYRCKPV